MSGIDWDAVYREREEKEKAKARNKEWRTHSEPDELPQVLKDALADPRRRRITHDRMAYVDVIPIMQACMPQLRDGEPVPDYWLAYMEARLHVEPGDEHRRYDANRAWWTGSVIHALHIEAAQSREEAEERSLLLEQSRVARHVPPDGPGMTPADIASAAGVSERTVRGQLPGLVSAGVLRAEERPGQGTPKKLYWSARDGDDGATEEV